MDLEKNTVIAQTKYVNDINSISSRQSNYTNRFTIPKTASNIRAMDYLSLPGNTSEVPYKKNECSLYSDTGECFIYKGWANIEDNGDAYEAYVYDGIIDFFKAIENKNLSDLGLEEVNHEKTIDAVKNTWNNNLPYTYIVADYNGYTYVEDISSLNVDYLIPSISVSWLWNKIFETFGAGGLGVGYKGAVFFTEAFKNLWMTYPKGMSSADSEVEAYEGEIVNASNQGNRSYLVFNAPDPHPLITSNDGVHFTFAQSGYYRVEISGSTDNQLGEQNRKMFFGRNENGQSAEGANPAYYILNPVPPQVNEYAAAWTINVEQYESICVVTDNYLGGASGNLRIYKLNNTEFDFSTVFSDFSIKDFVNEVLHRFGLTMFKEKYSSVNEFLTLQETLQTANIVDYSNIFNKKLSEKYTYGNYAQRNWFRYNYNDKEGDYKDASIDIDNANLPDSKDVIKSKIYSPEVLPVPLLNEPANVYKLWEKEVKENPDEGENPIKYKPLDKRYYFMRRELKNTTVALASPQLGQAGISNKYYRESFFRLSFKDIVQNYYGPLQQVLNKSIVVEVELYLKETDIANFDFRKLYYISQLSSYFIMNKINNYMPGKMTKCEMVRVLYSQQL